MKIILPIIILFSLVSKGYGQNINLREKDVASIDGITNAVLESISGKKNEKRDWERFRNLFWSTAQLNAVFHRRDSSWLKVNSLDEFISLAGTWYEDNGFKEYKFKNKIDHFGNIAQVFQSYGAALADGKEIERGINSYQLVFVNNRWWIVNLIWDSETDKNKIPKQFITK